MLRQQQIIGCDRLHFKSLTSTNQHLNKILASTSPDEGIVISAGYQTAGRGQIGRSWYSDRDRNIMLSTVIYPSFLKPMQQWSLSMITALAIKEYLDDKGIEDVTVKWPNDIYVKDHKIAGVLIENTLTQSSISSSVIGIGLNVNQTIWPSEIPNPTSLHILTKIEYNIDEEITTLLTYLDRKYQQIRFGTSLHKDYQAALYRKDRKCFFDYQSELLSGIITGTNEIGQLIVNHETNIRVYNFRDIRLVI